MSAFFITATGTDIGKTYVTAGLIRHLRAKGEAVRAVKPVMSGYEPAHAHQSDAGLLLDATGEAVTPEAIAGISPWRFSAPLSPDMAAAREGRSIAFPSLVAWCRGEIARAPMLLIEGVGGVMVPLDAHHTVLDWMKVLDLPVVLVTGTYLGTISHTLTAADVCRRSGLRIAAVVVDESGLSPTPPEETMACLRRFLADTLILGVSRPGTAPEFSRIWAKLISHA